MSTPGAPGAPGTPAPGRSAPDKPVPEPTPDTQPFWDGCARGELVLQRCRGCGIGLGIVGGLAAGAIIGGAVAGAAAGPYGAYAPAPGYAVYPGYAAPIPVGCPGGYWARRPLMDQWGNVVGYSRPRFFCP